MITLSTVLIFDKWKKTKGLKLAMLLPVGTNDMLIVRKHTEMLISASSLPQKETNSPYCLSNQLKAHLYYSYLSSLFLLFWSTWDITKEILESSFSIGKEGDWQRSTHSGESFTVECLDSWLAQSSFTAVKRPATEQAIRSKG